MNHSKGKPGQALPEVVLSIPTSEVMTLLEHFIPNKKIRALAFKECPEMLSLIARENGTEKDPSTGYLVTYKVAYYRMKESFSDRFKKHFIKPFFVDDLGQELFLSVLYSERIAATPTL